MTIKRALISVSDKNGLAGFAAGLHELGVELISTSGTESFHFNGVTPGSSVSASQLKSPMHLFPESLGCTPMPDVVWLRSMRTPIARSSPTAPP